MTVRAALVMGTRPEIIKLAPLARALGRHAELVMTDQHYDADLSDVFFSGAGLPRPSSPLNGVGGRDRAEQVVVMLGGLVEHFRATRPDVVVVQGDTNSASAGAQAAHYLGIPVVHVEAGLRSFDRAMPEEVNRLIIGSVADVHCCATPTAADNLLRAGTDPASVHITGNTIVEATLASLPDPDERLRLQRAAGVREGGYVLATAHRPENTDHPGRLQALLDGLGRLGAPVLAPLHPRTRTAVERYGLTVPPSLRLAPPVDHSTFLALAAGARLVVSDSGGVQEEVTVLGKPLVVVRRSTERPETVEAGFAVLTSAHEIDSAAAHLLRPGHPERLRTLPSPYGDGEASRRISALALIAAGVRLTPPEPLRPLPAVRRLEPVS